MNAATALSVEADVAEALDRIAALNPALNAFITILGTEALSRARLLDGEVLEGRPRRPLHGKVISLKDVIDVEGVATTAASRVREGHCAAADAPVVSRLRELGAVIIGKCNLHEFALGATSDESAFGPVRNPLDLRRSPGGSSGGSAAAVAAGLSWASIGTDTGGSIRIPAAACGIVGLKPAAGEISTAGTVPVAPSLDHVGLLTGKAADAWTLYTALVHDAVTEPRPAPLDGLVLGRTSGYFLNRLAPDVRRCFDEALACVARAGASIVDVTIEHAWAIPSTYACIVLPELAAYHAAMLESAPRKYSDGLRERLEWGRRIPADNYAQAQRDRVTLRHEVDEALARCHAVVLPTMPIGAPRSGGEVVTIDGIDEPVTPLMLRLTPLFNLTGHPAISIPCGHTSDGLPCGLQLAARETRHLLSVALACESCLPQRELAGV